MILFDFDGVLIDSVDEALVTASAALTGSPSVKISELSPVYVSLFRRYRYIIQTSSDLMILGRWCLAKQATSESALLSDSEFSSLKEKHRVDTKSDREKFFAARDVIAKKSPESWLTLNRPYEPLWSALQKIGGAELLILTNKNHQAVLDLGEHFGLRFSASNVYSADNGKTKSDNLGRICERTKCSRFDFVDDAVHNLAELNRNFPGILSCHLATWGYIGPNDEAYAKECGFSCMTQKDIVDLLHDIVL